MYKKVNKSNTTRSTDINVFSNEEFGSVRVVRIDDEPWFVGKDVAEILGYSNSRKAIGDHVDDEDKQPGVTIRDASQNRGMTVINESGLYSLVLSSKLPTAKKFKRWVTSEVLPSIRKHGAYMSMDVIEKTLTSPDFIIGLASKLKEEQQHSAYLQDVINQNKPLVEFASHILASDECVSMNVMAKLASDNGIMIGRNNLFAFLREQKVLMSDNVPYQSYMNRDWFKVTEQKVLTGDGHGGTRVVSVTLVKPKGQCAIIKMLRKKFGCRDVENVA